MQIRDRIRELRRVRASELLPHPNNWRTHPRGQQDALRGILAEVGYADALLARELPDGRLQLIDGHLRAEITPDQEVPVLVLDVDEKEAAKLLASLDPLAAMAGRDEEKLKELFADLETESEALQGLFDQLLVQEPTAGLTDPNEVPEPPTKAVTKPGDLWLLGDHRLLCGDATNPADLRRVVGSSDIGLCVTDPPYGVEVDHAWRDGIKNRRPSPRGGTIANDDRADWSAVFAELAAPVLYVWHSAQHSDTVKRGLEKLGFVVRQQIVWVKAVHALGRAHYQWKHEPCWYAVKKGANASWRGGRKQTTVWEYASPIMCTSRNEDATLHPTQKPVEVYEVPIRNHTARRAFVCDPFAGSGTAIIAAEGLERRCLAIEIDPRFCDVTVERWEKFTGKKARRHRKRGAT